MVEADVVLDRLDGADECQLGLDERRELLLGLESQGFKSTQVLVHDDDLWLNNSLLDDHIALLVSRSLPRCRDCGRTLSVDMIMNEMTFSARNLPAAVKVRPERAVTKYLKSILIMKIWVYKGEMVVVMSLSPKE